MITQMLMDLATSIAVWMLNLWPPMPDVNSYINTVASGLYAIADTIQALQPIVPFEVMAGFNGVVTVMIAHTGVLIVARLILWALKR